MSDLSNILDPTWWELALVPVIAALLALAARFGIRLHAGRLEVLLYGSDRRAIISVGLISLAVAMACTAIRASGPRVHDEFSYLLAADTFAHGRLTNPPHPMWRHFETMHVLMQPTMQSKYPPAQGLVLAAGQALTGRPITGVWASFALACAALYWSLRPWTPRRWAFFGGLLPSLRFGTGLYFHDNHWTYWASTYWGGAIALLGGCLVFGAALRIFRGKADRRESLLLGVGLSILAASRPWEGLALAAPILLLVVWRLGRSAGAPALFRLVGPAVAVTVLALAVLAYYNYQVTGSAAAMPYQAYMQQYDVTPVLRFQEFRPEPPYGNPQMRQYHLGFQVDMAKLQLNGLGFGLEDLRGLAAFLLGRPLAGAALLGLLFWRSRRALLVTGLLAIAAASHALTLIHPYWPHYFAPHVPLLLLLVLRGLRVLHLLKLQGGRRPGVFLADAMVIATVGALIFSAALRAERPSRQGEAFLVARNAIEERLLALAGDDLILVRYGPRHFVHSEWVYNNSDIDKQPVVWARELTPDQNAALVEYFQGRQAWLVEADARPPRIVPYRPNAR